MIKKLINKFWGLLDKIIAKRKQAIQNKSIDIKKKTQVEKRWEYVRKLQELEKFVKWLNNKGLQTRAERKLFWKSVAKGQPILEDAINKMISVYTPDKDQGLSKEAKKVIKKKVKNQKG